MTDVLTNLQKLPPICATIHPSANETILIRPGERELLPTKGIERDNRLALWAALHQIRDAVQELGPVGAMRAEEALDGPTPQHEADEIIKGIQAIVGTRAHIDAPLWNAWNDLDAAIIRLQCASIFNLSDRSKELNEMRKRLAQALRHRDLQP